MRLGVGMWLAVALEFELAADILRTAVAPSWNDIGLLAAIIGLRTILNYFLQLEIEKAQARHTSEASGERVGARPRPLVPVMRRRMTHPAPVAAQQFGKQSTAIP